MSVEAERPPTETHAVKGMARLIRQTAENPDARPTLVHRVILVLAAFSLFSTLLAASGPTVRWGFLGILLALGVCALVAVIVGVYHWRVLRADAASRPAKHEVEAPPIATTPVLAVDSVITPTSVPTSHGKRYVLTVTDASDDDVHQALANLPPAASYRLIPESES